MGKYKVTVPEYHAVARLPASELARWLHQNANRWWTADGETRLMETLSFPCPGNELAEAIEKFGDRKVEILQDVDAPANVPQIKAAKFRDYANTQNRYDARNFLLRWQGTKQLWLLSEDIPASESSDEETDEGN